MATRCAATTTAGTPCRGFAGPGRRFCINHDPDRRELAQAGRAAGGRRKAEQHPPAPTLPLEEAEPPQTLADLRRLVSQTIVGVQAGRIDPRRGGVVVQLAKSMERMLRADSAPSTVIDLARLPFVDLARRTVRDIVTCIDADPDAEPLRGELRAMLAEPAAELSAAPPPAVENAGPGVATVLRLLEGGAA